LLVAFDYSDNHAIVSAEFLKLFWKDQ
jgi:hypothetical protein